MSSFFRSTTNLKCHTNESYQDASGHINSICYTESSKLRDTRVDFFSVGKFDLGIEIKLNFANLDCLICNLCEFFIRNHQNRIRNIDVMKFPMSTQMYIPHS